MRGAEGVWVVAVLALAGVATGGLVGLALGAAWAGAGGEPLPPAGAAAAAGVAVVADLAHRTTGRLRPLAVGRQVPQAWGRLFGPGTAALLYGARLGVGPLTILTSWTWWAMLLVAASLGPWASAATGAAFAVARVTTMVVVVAGARSGPAMGRRMAALRHREPVVAWATMGVVGMVGIGALAW
ncbi:MAG TPA: hypothetical protein VMN58_05155 [Acidimicrobiales bacterium]|nr:hypothetical protein [Acidimicrobiales bacterium]